MKIVVGAVALFSALCAQAELTVPEQRDDGLTVGDLSSVASDEAALSQLVVKLEAGEFGEVCSLLIAKDDTLLLEEYFRDAGIDKLHPVRSHTKSVTSYVLGKAIELGDITSVNDPILNYLPEVDRNKILPGIENVTIKDCLTMSAGLRGDEPNPGGFEEHTHVPWILEDWTTSLVTDESRFSYSYSDPVIISHVLFNATGKTIEEMAVEHFFQPMGIETYKFRTYSCGLTYPIDSMELRSRDVLKLGLLTLNGGVWNGQQLLNTAYIDEATTAHAVVNNRESFGYFWWVNEISFEGESYEVKTAFGAGGQMIYVISELDLVVVFTADNANKFTLLALLQDEIVPALFSEPAAQENLITHGDFESGSLGTLTDDAFLQDEDQDKGWVQRTNAPPHSIIDDGTGNHLAQLGASVPLFQGVTLDGSVTGSKLKLSFDWDPVDAGAELRFLLIGGIAPNSDFQLNPGQDQNVSGVAVFDFVGGATVAHNGFYSNSVAFIDPGSRTIEFDIAALSGGTYNDVSDFSSLNIAFTTSDNDFDGNLDNVVLLAGGDTILYSHSFNGTGALSNSAVDQVASGDGSTWTANNTIGANGRLDLSGKQGAAILSFHPELDQEYRLDVSFRGMSSGYDYYAVGFVNTSLGADGAAPFTTSPEGLGWLQVNKNKRVISRGARAYSSQVINDSTVDGPAIPSVTDLDLRIDLKRVGTDSYDIAYYVKDKSESSYTALGSVLGYDYNKVITGVGFGIDGASVTTTGTIESFTLTAISQEDPQEYTTGISPSGSGGMVISFLAQLGKTYQLQGRDNLVEGGWKNIGDPVSGSGNNIAITVFPSADAGFPSADAGFFRVIVE